VSHEKTFNKNVMAESFHNMARPWVLSGCQVEIRTRYLPCGIGRCTISWTSP
jgi:hypothetical protein